MVARRRRASWARTSATVLLARGDDGRLPRRPLDRDRRTTWPTCEGHARFTLVVADVSREVAGRRARSTACCNLASPASPPAYLARPLETLAVGSEGTRRLLELARPPRGPVPAGLAPARSTATRWCTPRSSPTGATSTRSGPAASTTRPSGSPRRITMATTGPTGSTWASPASSTPTAPGSRPGDGRVVSNFIVQALRGEPLTVYGDGSQTRSLCYVDDEVAGLVALLDSDADRPGQHRQPRRAHHPRAGPRWCSR